MNPAQSTVAVGLSAMDHLLDGGTIVIYGSQTLPTTPETALTTATALATFQFQNPAFPEPTFSGGYEQAVANFVATSVAPSVTGSATATFARSYRSDGTTVVADYTVGTTGTDITLGSTTITQGVNVTMNSFLDRMPAS